MEEGQYEGVEWLKDYEKGLQAPASALSSCGLRRARNSVAGARSLMCSPHSSPSRAARSDATDPKKFICFGTKMSIPGNAASCRVCVPYQALRATVSMRGQSRYCFSSRIDSTASLPSIIGIMMSMRTKSKTSPPLAPPPSCDVALTAFSTLWPVTACS